MTKAYTLESTQERIEELVGELYVQYFRMRQLGEYATLYEDKGILLNMLAADRLELLRQHPEILNG